VENTSYKDCPFKLQCNLALGAQVRVWPWGNLVAPMLHLGLGAHVRGLVLGEP